jgi:hypothetical protein
VRSNDEQHASDQVQTCECSKKHEFTKLPARNCEYIQRHKIDPMMDRNDTTMKSMA